MVFQYELHTVLKQTHCMHCFKQQLYSILGSTAINQHQTLAFSFEHDATAIKSICI